MDTEFFVTLINAISGKSRYEMINILERYLTYGFIKGYEFDDNGVSIITNDGYKLYKVLENEEEVVEEVSEFDKNWEEFRNTGLFVFANCFLHIFGWCIELKIDNGKIVSVMPKKCCYSGFAPETMDKAYDRIKNYIKVKEEEEVFEDPTPFVQEKIDSVKEAKDEFIKYKKDGLSDELKKILETFKQVREAQEKKLN